MAKFPGDLESAYSATIQKFIASINKAYMVELRRVLRERDTMNALYADAFRRNESLYQTMLKKLRGIRDKIFSKYLYAQTLKNMNNVMLQATKNVERTIQKKFEKKNFPIPPLELQANSDELKKAIKRNVELVQMIAKKQSQALEDKVLEAITSGGSDPNIIIEEVKSQIDNGEAYAKFVAQDQLTKAHGAINQEAQQRAGFPGYIWRTTGDNRVRGKTNPQPGKANHYALKDRYFKWDTPPDIGDGRTLHPGEDYLCRCYAEPAFDPGDKD